jgi:hypothetical protein
MGKKRDVLTHRGRVCWWSRQMHSSKSSRETQRSKFLSWYVQQTLWCYFRKDTVSLEARSRSVAGCQKLCHLRWCEFCENRTHRHMWRHVAQKVRWASRSIFLLVSCRALAPTIDKAVGLCWMSLLLLSSVLSWILVVGLSLSLSKVLGTVPRFPMAVTRNGNANEGRRKMWEWFHSPWVIAILNGHTSSHDLDSSLFHTCNDR